MESQNTRWQAAYELIGLWRVKTLDGKRHMNSLAYGESNNYSDIFENFVFKHVHAASTDEDV